MQLSVGTLKKALEDMENGVYDFTQNGECSQCGSCCSNYIPISSKEIKEIKRYVAKNRIRPQNHIMLFQNPGFDLTCPFLDESKRTEKCTIYEVRPLICREFCCDHPRKKILADRRKFHAKYAVVDMRKTFFTEEK